MKSILAVGFGVLLALLLGLLVAFGILAPVFTTLFGLEMAGSTAVPTSLLVFTAAFAFYFGGMAASYRAPARRKLHGTLVALVAFVVSPAINVATGKGAFPGLDSSGAIVLAAIFFVASVAASYVGARRGEALYDHNHKIARRRSDWGARRVR